MDVLYQQTSFTANQPLRARTPTNPPDATTVVHQIARRIRRVLEHPGCGGNGRWIDVIEG